jgi:biotin carboxyl carrier protein
VSSSAFELLIDGEVRRFSVETRDATVTVHEGDRLLAVEARRLSANELRFRWNGRSVRVFLARDGERTFVAIDGRQYVVSEARAETDRPGGGDEIAEGGSLRIKAPMPGKVTKVAVVEGEEVHGKQALVIVEAMKMENEVRTSIDGVVRKVYVAVGDLVDADRILVEIEPKAA